MSKKKLYVIRGKASVDFLWYKKRSSATGRAPVHAVDFVLGRELVCCRKRLGVAMNRPLVHISCRDCYNELRVLIDKM